MIIKSAQKNDKKNVSKFLVIGFSNELVVIVGNPNKHLFSPWNHLNKKVLVPRGHLFEKSNKPFDHAGSGNCP